MGAILTHMRSVFTKLELETFSETATISDMVNLKRLREKVDSISNHLVSKCIR